MERLVFGATIAAATLAAASARAQEVDGDVHDEASSVVEGDAYGASNLEAGFFVGGFISNYYSQFYDDSLFPADHVDSSRNRQQLDTVSPELGGRFAVYPRRYFGVEAELSTIMAQTKITGDSVQIYGLAATALLQHPGRWTPYAGLGISVRYTSSDNTVLGSDMDFPVHASGGVKVWLSPAIAVRAEVRYLRGPSQGYGMSPSYFLNAGYGEFSLGLSFNPKAAVEHHVRHIDDDPDHDGVHGDADKCPNEPGNGNPDGCPNKDSDGDGIMDNVDKCPHEAETVNGYKDDDGCPDTVPDTDGDGIDDVHDKCPEQAEDKDGFQDDDGCPDPDNDNDGVLDASDKCPDQAGPIENRGCPDADRDGDGIVDRLDNCPDEKGTEKNHGCKAAQLVSIEKDKLLIVGQINFTSGSATIAAGSKKTLNNMASVMMAHPEFTKVKVEGHTDNVGKSDFNQKLSEQRAGAIVDYLVKKGVAPERLEPIGHGDSAPIDDNKTAKGRAQNRRVEFNIVYQ